MSLRRRIGEAVVEWGLEVDLPRQARRLGGVVHGGDVHKLRDAVEGRRVLVTGASSGIGMEVARRVALAGGEVVLVARREDRLRELAGEVERSCGVSRAQVMPCDLSDLEKVDELAARVLDELGPVDVLVNNAAHSIRRPLRVSSERLHDFERLIRLNYLSVVHLTMPLLREMRARGNGQIVNVSTAGTQFGPEPRFGAYLASKGALDALARSAAPETRREGVVWTTVHMPLVRTDMIRPTTVYRHMPAMSVSAAAGMVLDGIVRRPVRVTHPYGTAMHLVDSVVPGVVEAVMGSRFARYM